MQETSYKCDECGYATSNRRRHPGWINFRIESGFVSVKNTSMENGEAYREISIGEKDFCCSSCLQKWAKSQFA